MLANISVILIGFNLLLKLTLEGRLGDSSLPLGLLVRSSSLI